MRAVELNIPLRSGGVRTGPLNGRDLKRLGLSDLRKELSQDVGRPVNFMIFDEAKTAVSRSSSMGLQ